MPRRGQGQPNADLSDSETCSAAERRVQSRLSECSSTYARQVCSLLRDFSICGSDNEDPELPAMQAHPFLEEDTDRDERAEFKIFEAFPEPGYALPGDFLSAHTRRCSDFPGQRHGPGTCWCYIAAETLDEHSWFLPDGGLANQALQLIDELPDPNIILQDSFGNTQLHFLASLNLSDPRYSIMRGFLLIWVREGAIARLLANSMSESFSSTTSRRRQVTDAYS